ncbi:MAG: hypothetical protein LIO85_08800 [Rikenellaceae bacterium]|nr:hypothetical protein [Rikenellaceae bacterium]
MQRLRLILTAAIVCAVISSCGSRMRVEDFSRVKDFHEHNFGDAQGRFILSDSVDLYIDYSTCVAEAGNSRFYQAVHPAIIDCNPVFWSIKGSAITRETDDRQKVYELLRSIREVNYADIKGAVSQITSGNRQAIIITDGEYFQRNLSGDNMNNPYLAPEFRQWLAKGGDVYIFSEPYLESNRYEKFRYYMLFTNSRKPNNIYDIVSRNLGGNYDVKLLHLTSSGGDLRFEYAGQRQPAVNEVLSLNPDTYYKERSYEAQEYQIGWKDIYKYILNAYDDQGRPVEGGDAILRGIFVETGQEDSYRITAVKPVVYLLTDDFIAYEDSLRTEEQQLPVLSALKPVNEIFDVDNEIFDRTGEIVLRLHRNFDSGSAALHTDRDNLFRIDFVIDRAEDNFSGNPEISDDYKWVSIERSSAGKLNTSLYESIRQTLQDPSINPKGKVIYTIYLLTPNFK